MIEVDTITIDDNEYMILNEINDYVYLSNINDPKDFIIQKKVTKNDERLLIPLDNREEFNKALELFAE